MSLHLQDYTIQYNVSSACRQGCSYPDFLNHKNQDEALSRVEYLLTDTGAFITNEPGCNAVIDGGSVNGIELQTRFSFVSFPGNGQLVDAAAGATSWSTGRQDRNKKRGIKGSVYTLTGQLL